MSADPGLRDAAKDLTKTQLAESVFAGGEMGARMRSVDWSTTALGPWSSGRNRFESACASCWALAHPMFISWAPDYTMLYDDAYGVVVGTRHPEALGCSCREVLAGAWDFIGPGGKRQCC